VAELRALSIRQPYTGAIAYGDKRRENRSMPTRYRGLLALHAARAVEWGAPAAAWLACGLTPYLPGDPRKAWADALDLGAVIGVAELAGCHHADECLKGAFGFCSPWSMAGQFHWELSGVRSLCPVPRKGALGLWRLPADVEQAVRAQLEGT
jgi:hypothetical protein